MNGGLCHWNEALELADKIDEFSFVGHAGRSL
jgi:hypothetical protein